MHGANAWLSQGGRPHPLGARSPVFTSQDRPAFSL